MVFANLAPCRLASVTPARLQGTSTPTPKQECPPPGHTLTRAEIRRRPYRRRSRPPPPSPRAPAVPRLHEVLPVPDRAWFRRCAIRQEDAGCASPCGILYGAVYEPGVFLVRQQKCFGLPAVFAGAAGGVGGGGMRGMVYELCLRCGYLRKSRLGNSAAFC